MRLKIKRMLHYYYYYSNFDPLRSILINFPGLMNDYRFNYLRRSHKVNNKHSNLKIVIIRFLFTGNYLFIIIHKFTLTLLLINSLIQNFLFLNFLCRLFFYHVNFKRIFDFLFFISLWINPLCLRMIHFSFNRP